MALLIIYLFYFACAGGARWRARLAVSMVRMAHLIHYVPFPLAVDPSFDSAATSKTSTAVDVTAASMLPHSTRTRDRTAFSHKWYTRGLKQGS